MAPLHHLPSECSAQPSCRVQNIKSTLPHTCLIYIIIGKSSWCAGFRISTEEETLIYRSMNDMCQPPPLYNSMSVGQVKEHEHDVCVCLCRNCWRDSVSISWATSYYRRKPDSNHSLQRRFELSFFLLFLSLFLFPTVDCKHTVLSINRINQYTL